MLCPVNSLFLYAEDSNLFVAANTFTELQCQATQALSDVREWLVRRGQLILTKIDFVIRKFFCKEQSYELFNELADRTWLIFLS